MGAKRNNLYGTNDVFHLTAFPPTNPPPSNSPPLHLYSKIAMAKRALSRDLKFGVG